MHHCAQRFHEVARKVEDFGHTALRVMLQK